jgi:hypothetical protein
VLAAHQSLPHSGNDDDGPSPLLFAVSHAYLMNNDDAQALRFYQDAVEPNRRGSAETPMAQWCQAHYYDLQSVQEMKWSYTEAEPVKAKELRADVLKTLCVGAFHAFGGRFSMTAKEFRHASLLLQEQGLDSVRSLLFQAGFLASGLGSDMDFGESCLKQAGKETKDWKVGFPVNMQLAEMYTRSGRFREAQGALVEAERSVGTTPARLKQLAQGQLYLALRMHDWPRLVSVYDSCKRIKLESGEVAKWLRPWTEVYVFALRQVGNDQLADEQFEELERHK